MKKKINDRKVFYDIAWSPLVKYEKYDAMKIPELAGIISFEEKNRKGITPLLVYACWRDGLRVGIRRLMDRLYTPFLGITSSLEEISDLYYRYTMVDSSPQDMKDIIFWLIRNYNPRLNSQGFEDSGRYEDISVKEREMLKGQVVEKFPVH